jgi:acetyl esterase/lipase
MEIMFTRRQLLAMSAALPAAAQKMQPDRSTAAPAPKRDSIEILEVEPDPADHRIKWGDEAEQFGDLRVPQGSGPFPVIINIHGGYWRAQYNLKHAGHLCTAFKQKGIATWNIEYRRLGQPGGGFPGTFDDSVAGARHLWRLLGRYPLDDKRVIVMGHSAGGQLALYVARQLINLRGVVALAPVADLRRAEELNLSRGVVRQLLGGPPSAVGDRYRQMSPIERVPIKVPQVIFHGSNDEVVPVEISKRYVAAAQKAGDPATLIELKGAGHFELIDPRTTEWASIERSAMALLAMGLDNMRDMLTPR